MMIVTDRQLEEWIEEATRKVGYVTPYNIARYCLQKAGVRFRYGSNPIVTEKWDRYFVHKEIRFTTGRAKGKKQRITQEIKVETL